MQIEQSTVEYSTCQVEYCTDSKVTNELEYSTVAVRRCTVSRARRKREKAVQNGSKRVNTGLSTGVGD